MITRTVWRIALGLTIGAMAAPGVSAMQDINSVTCDGAACRQPFELVDGRSVTIGLTGDGLDALESGMVTDRSGRRIEGVAVELAPLAPPSRTRGATQTRDVTLTVQGIAATLTGLELRFTTNARRTVTAPLDLSTAAAEQTRITRVSAANVRVEAGGAAVAVAVEGVNLAAVTRARLLLNGRPVSDPVGRLTAPAGSTTGQAGDELVLEVAAGPSVQAGNYELELVAGRQRITVPASISVVHSVADAIASSVTAATPSSVRLVAGGNPQIVTLTGTNLDRVTAAHVERGGMEMGSVTALLRAATGPGSRDVILTAKTGAGPPWDVPLELVLEGGGAGLRVPLALSAQSPPPPSVATPQLRMTGLRLPIEIETQVLRMSGLPLPIRVATQHLRMTGIREEK